MRPTCFPVVKKLLTISALSLLSALSTAYAEDLVTSIIKNGHLNFDVRYRFEAAEQDMLKDARAHTLRTRLGWQTGDYYGLSGVIGFSNVTLLNDRRANTGRGTTPGLTEFTTIPDPNGTVVHEAYLNIDPFAQTNIRFGRQHISLDNLRFIGDVAFRQTNQVMDAVSLTNKSIDDFTLFYAYVHRVNRVWGEEAFANFSDNDNNTHLVNIGYHGIDLIKLSAYYYDIDNEDVSIFSTKTYGARAFGEVPITHKWDLLYDFEYAHQNDAHNNQLDISESYYGAHLGLGYNDMFKLIVSREDLGGDKNAASNVAFRTPLATLHKFQGWADAFLTTPTAGIEDTYVTAIATFDISGPLTFKAIYHDFEASDGGADFGHELDLHISKKFCKHWGVQFEYANYSADGGFDDIKRYWLTGTYKL